MAHDLLVTNGTLVTRDASESIVPAGAVWIREGVIEETGPAAGIAGRHPDAPRLDARGGVVLPGLVNAHLHLYSAFARGLGLPGPAPKNFLEVLKKLWWRLDRALTADDVYASAVSGAIEAAKQGTTTLFDHHASPFACPDSLSLVRDAIDLVGLRACLAYEVSDRDGRALEGIAENVRFIESCRKDPGGRFAGLFGLHASFTLSDATLAAAREAADSLQVPFHIHVAEDGVDGERCRVEHGMGVVERLAARGILRSGTIAAHAIHIEPGDARILAERDVVIAHCPQSNANNAVGTADLAGLVSAGVEVALGTDGMTPSVLHEMQFGAVVHRLARRDPAVGFEEIGYAATRTNPRVASVRLGGPPLGQIAPGFAGDLAVFRYEAPTPLAAQTLAGHLIFGLSRAPVSATVVAGRVVQEDGVIRGLDESKIMARSRELAAAFWERFAAA